jgi:hypothetical protein
MTAFSASTLEPARTGAAAGGAKLWDSRRYRILIEKLESIQRDYLKSMLEAQQKVQVVFNEEYKQFLTAVQVLQNDLTQGTQAAYQVLLKASQDWGQGDAQARCLTAWQNYVTALNEVYSGAEGQKLEKAYGDLVVSLTQAQGSLAASQHITDDYQRLQQALIDLQNQEAVKGRLQQSYSELVAKFQSAVDEGRSRLFAALQVFSHGLLDAWLKANSQQRLELAVRDLLAKLANISQQAQDSGKECAVTAIQQIQDAWNEFQKATDGH